MTRVCGGTYLCALQRRARAQWRRWCGVAGRGAARGVPAREALISVTSRAHTHRSVARRSPPFLCQFFRALFDGHYGVVGKQVVVQPHGTVLHRRA